MSLLNDALKRAGEANDARGAGPPADPPLQPVHYPARAPWSPRLPLFALLVLTLALAAYFVNRWLSAVERRATGESSHRTVASVRPGATGTTASTIRVTTNLVARAPEPAPVPPAVAIPVPPTTNLPPVSTGAVAATSSPATNVAATAEETAPVLKLQSIIFRLRNPSVVINGEMLSVGDSIKGARVVRIDRHTATLEWRGRTNTLELPSL